MSTSALHTMHSLPALQQNTHIFVSKRQALVSTAVPYCQRIATSQSGCILTAFRTRKCVRAQSSKGSKSALRQEIPMAEPWNKIFPARNNVICKSQPKSDDSTEHAKGGDGNHHEQESAESVAPTRVLTPLPSTWKNRNFIQLAGRQFLVGALLLGSNPAGLKLLTLEWTGPVGVVHMVGGLLIGGLPLALFGEWLQRRANPTLQTINRETATLTLRLFGTRRQPLSVGALAGALSMWTAVSEEVCYRGAVMPALASATHSLPLGWLLSSLIFGAAHWGGDRTKEGAALVSLQCGYGLVFGLLTWVAGGGLVPAVAAHFLYDFWTFFGTHMLVTGQVEYSRAGMKREDEDPSVLAEVARLKEEHKLTDRFVSSSRLIFLWINTKRTGFLDSNELRVGLCAFGKRPSASDAEAALESVDRDHNLKLDFGEFLGLVVRMGLDPETAAEGLVYS